MAILQVFKIRLPNCVAGKYIFKSGKEANFVGGKYVTAVPEEIAELENEVVLNHPHIFRDAEEMVMDTEVKDPLAVLREKFFAEFQATATATANTVDKGNTAAKGTDTLGGIATSTNISGVAAASNQGGTPGVAPGFIAASGSVKK